jgi:hypothetical protein
MNTNLPFPPVDEEKNSSQSKVQAYIPNNIHRRLFSLLPLRGVQDRLINLYIYHLVHELEAAGCDPTNPVGENEAIATVILNKLFSKYV